MKTIEIIIAIILILVLAIFSWCCLVVSSELSRKKEYEEIEGELKNERKNKRHSNKNI